MDIMPSRKDMIKELETFKNKESGLLPENEKMPSRREMIEELESLKGEDSWIKSKAKNLGNTALDYGMKVAEKVDSYTGAPARKGLDELAQGKEPFTPFLKQFGEDPRLAPTGKEIANKRLGLSTKETIDIPGVSSLIGKVSPAGLAGFGVDVAADPTNVIPGRTMLKTGGIIGLGAVKHTGRAAAKLGDLAVGKDILTRIERGGEEAVKAAAEGLSRFNKPRVADDFPEMSEIAKRNGIDLTNAPKSVEFGESSVINRMERKIRESPLGQAEMDAFNNFHNSVQTAIKKRMSAMSGKLPASRLNAGVAIRSGYNKAVDEMFNQIDHTYKSVSQMVPGMTLGKAEASLLEKNILLLKAEAARRLQFAVLPSQKQRAQHIIDAANAIDNAVFEYGTKNGKKIKFVKEGSFENLADAIKNIGEAGYKVDVIDVRPDVEVLRKIYKLGSDAIINTTKKAFGKDIADDLVKNNETMTTFFKQRDSFYKVLNNKKIPHDKLFDTLVMRGSVDQINDLKKILPPEEFAAIKGALINTLAKRNVEGNIYYRQFNNALEAKADILGAVFDKNEIEELKALNRLGDRSGPEFLSTSGTGASMDYVDPANAIKNYGKQRAALNDMVNSARNYKPPKNRPMMRGPREGISKAAQVESVQRRSRQQREEEE